MNECRKTMTVVEFNRIVTRSLLWGCKKKWKKNLANSSEISWARPFCLFLWFFFFGEIFSFAKSVLCYSWQFCVAIGWPKLRICGAEHPIHRPDSISIPFQTPTLTPTQTQTHKPNPRPHDLQLPVASGRVIYKTLDVAISSVAPWTFGFVSWSLDEWHS